MKPNHRLRKQGRKQPNHSLFIYAKSYSPYTFRYNKAPTATTTQKKKQNKTSQIIRGIKSWSFVRVNQNNHSRNCNLPKREKVKLSQKKKREEKKHTCRSAHRNRTGMLTRLFQGRPRLFQTSVKTTNALLRRTVGILHVCQYLHPNATTKYYVNFSVFF